MFQIRWYKVDRRCLSAYLLAFITGCHPRVPSFEGFTSTPLGIELDSPPKLEQHAAGGYQALFVTRVMPLANLTQMTDSERNLVAHWFEGY